MHEEIAIIGMAGRFAEAGNAEVFWNKIASGCDMVRPFPDSRLKELREATGFDTRVEDIANGGYLDYVSLFEPEYFKISREESKYIDPQQRLLLELTEEAIQSGGIHPAKLSGKAAGVFMASSINTYALGLGSMPMGVVNSSEAAISGRISYAYNFTGPCMTVNTESSSVGVALHYACLSLRDRESDVALVGGSRIHVVPPGKKFVYENMMTSSSQKIRAFDKDADGIIAGEGGGVLVLKRLKNALEDNDIIFSIIKSTGVNSNGSRSIGLSAPNQEAQADLIAGVIDKAGIDPHSVSYIEAHGTGTNIGDPIEIAGITGGFRRFLQKKQFIPIGTVKTNIGHLGSAATIAGLIKTILALQHKKIPPSLHFKVPNPQIDFEDSPVFVNTTLTDWVVNGGDGVRRAGVNSLGLTGSNAYAILEEPPARGSVKSTGRRNVFTFSALSQPSLDGMVTQMGHWLETVGEPNLDEVAYTLNTGRRHLEHRFAVTAVDKEELLHKLDTVKTVDSAVASSSRSFSFFPAFIIPGPGSAASVPCDEYYQAPLFETHYCQCLEDLSPQVSNHLGHFAFQYALWRQLDAFGITPKAVLGIGAGKPAADVMQGKISLEEGIKTSSGWTAENTSIDSQKLSTVLDRMLEKKYNHFFLMGGDEGVNRELTGLIEQHMDRRPGVYLHRLDLHRYGIPELLQRLYGLGFDPDWDMVFHDLPYRRLNLPSYPFHRKSYFLKIDSFKNNRQKEERPEIRSEMPDAGFDDILAIFKAVVSEQLDLEVDYVDNGGNSIGVMQLITMIKEKYHTTINIDRFYGAATLRELIRLIQEQVLQGVEHAEETSDSTGNQHVRHRSVQWFFPLKPEAISAETAQPGNILLTGGTGFLGSQLLKELLERTGSVIYCLTRGETEAGARDYCREKWNYYFPNLLAHHLDTRIQVVRGDIAQPRLGMEAASYNELAETIDSVMHCAADVRHYGKYNHFETVNVGGTRNVIDFCMVGNQKKLHHVSTKAIAEYPTEDVRYKENHLDVGQVFRGRVYARSKFEAEQQVHLARTKGLEAAIYRIGDLTGRFSDGVFQQNIETNRFYNNIKALVLLKKIFHNAFNTLKFELSPVDLCTRAMLNLMLLRDSFGYTFHLMNPFLVSLRTFADALRNLGSPIDEVDFDSFKLWVDRELKDRGFVKELSWISYLLSLDEYASLPSLTFDCDFTVKVLEKTGFVWPEIQADYVEKMIRHSIESGYINLEHN